MESDRLKSNIQKIFWLNASFSFLILMPVIVPFFQSRGLNMAQVYQLQAIFALFVLLLEVPSGYFSDLFGRKKTLMAASVFQGLGFFLMALSPNFEGMIFAEVFLAIAVSLFSGTDLSLLYDSAQALKTSGSPIKHIGQSVFFRQAGESVAGLVGGWLLFIHLDTPAWLQASTGLVSFWIASSLYEPPRDKMSYRKHSDNFLYMVRSLFFQSKLLNLILIASIFYNFATLVAVWSFQFYWNILEVPIYYFGYLWFLINIVVGLTARSAHSIERKWGSEATLVVIGLLPVLGFLGMAFVDRLWGLIFCFCFQITRGLNSVVLADALNKRITSDMRATANSIMGLGTRVLMISVGPIVGQIIDEYGNSEAQRFLGFLFIGVFVAVLLPFLGMRRSFEPVTEK